MGEQSCVIFGLDPGSWNFGFAAIACQREQVQLLEFGVIQVPAKMESLANRLHCIHQKLEALFECHKPDIVSIEETFYHKNVKSVVILSHARAIGLLVSAKYSAILKEFSPRKIKLSVTGQGSASKEAVQKMVCRIVGISESNLSLDATDALATALCAHYDRIRSEKYPEMLSKKSSKRRKSSRWTSEDIQKIGVRIAALPSP
jgi:crossover junction endodeoxyribonuclease RuvC